MHCRQQCTGTTLVSSDAVNWNHSPGVFAIVNMKIYISLLLVILVLFVTQPNTGQCGSHEVDLLQKIHCALEKANVKLEMNQNGNM